MDFHVVVLVTAWTMNIHMVSSVSMCHRPQHGLWWQCRPWTSTRLQVTVQATHINMASGGNPNIHTTMASCSNTDYRCPLASGGSTGLGYPHGLPWQPRPDIHMNLLLQYNLEQWTMDSQHGLRGLHRP